jgi:hypothetical protein
MAKRNGIKIVYYKFTRKFRAEIMKILSYVIPNYMTPFGKATTVSLYWET